MHDLVRAWKWFMARPADERARLVRRFARHAGAHGWRDALRVAGRQTPVSRDAYLDWCTAHTPGETDLARMREASDRFAYRPLVTIVTPVYNTRAVWLEACADSVLAQVYPHWQWSIGNDGSTSVDTLDALASIAARDPRIVVTNAPANGGIASATNLALTRAGGEYVALMDSDDALLPHALFRMVEHLNRAGERPDVLYSDEDKLELDGQRCEAYFKPDWSPDLFMSNMYVCHLLMARRALVHDVGGFRTAFDFSQDYDLMLRLMERANRVDHVADILYHWRKVPQSGATVGDAKPAAHVAGRAALQDALERRGVAGLVEDAGPAGFYRVRYHLNEQPLVSVVTGQDIAARERLETAWPHIEYVTNAEQARGGYLVWLDGDVRAQHAEWLDALIEVVTQPGVGVAAPRVLDTGGSIREAGLVLGGASVATRALNGLPAGHGGYFGSAIAVRNVSAVGGSCFVTPRAVWHAVGGWDASLLDADSRAIDYCLRVREAGFRVLVTPWSTMLAPRVAAGVSLPAADEQRLRARWETHLTADSYQNPHLSWPGLLPVA